MKYDFIIVGQGIAGTLLTHFLLESEKKVLVIDEYNPNSSSNVAAGIIHPITGRRLVKTWLYDEAFSLVASTYYNLGKNFTQTFFKEFPIIEIYSSIKNKNDWELKSCEPGFEKLIGQNLPPGFNLAIDAPFGAIKILGGGFLKLKELIQNYRTHLLKEEILLNEKFDFAQLRDEENGIRYKNFEAQKIIFCDGFSGQQNPFFKSLPFQPAKGEVLIIKCDSLNENEIINKGIYILPLGNHLFKIGSTFDWNNLNDEITSAAKEKLIQEFAAIVKSPFEIIEQFAAVRPTVKNRKPFLGFHPQHPHIGIFNGLGTKGVLLAPYFAKMLCENLVEGKELMSVVDVAKQL